MAMLASDMNCLAAVGVEDFYSLARPRSTDRQRLRVGKIIVVAQRSSPPPASPSSRPQLQARALPLYYTITAIVAGGLAGLFLLAFLFPTPPAPEPSPASPPTSPSPSGPSSPSGRPNPAAGLPPGTTT